jgi:hypothetical protein
MLDLAVIAVTLVVLGSLALLAWTLGVSAAGATGRGRARVATLRARVADTLASMRHDTAGDAANR